MKWLTIATILGGGTGIIALFTYLFLLAGINYSYTGDSVCDELECTAYINVNTSYWEICFSHYNNTKYEDETLFKKRTRSRTLHINLDKVSNIIYTDPPILVTWYVKTVKRYANHKDEYGYWRLLKDGDCWRRNAKPNKNKLIGHPSKGQIIKWSFELGDKVSIDPIWISYKYIYENLSRQVPIYREDLILVKEDCFTNITTSSIQCNPAYNYTTKTLIGYKTVYYDGVRIGVEIDSKETIGFVNIEGNILSKWAVPIRDRNFKEYGRCRPFEITKGVCKEIDLLK